MVQIEISYTTNEDEFPEHYGYYNDFDEAQMALDMIKEDLIKSGDYSLED